MQTYFNTKKLKANGFSNQILLANDVKVQIRLDNEKVIHVLREDNQMTESGNAKHIRNVLEQWERQHINPKPLDNRPPSNIGFARVSSRGQDLAIQVKALEEQGCTKIFQWKHSGIELTNKQALMDLLDYVIEGDNVMVTKIDRLGRSLNAIINTIHALTEKGVTFQALDGRINTGDKDSKLMIAIFAVLAEIDRDLIVSRTWEGKQHSGNFGGAKPKLTEEQRTEVLEKLLNGVEKPVIQAEYNVSKSTLIRLQNSVPNFAELKLKRSQSE